MKFFYVGTVALIQAFTSLAASSASTVVCETCPTTTASPQVVTRTSGPTTPCSAPALTAIYASSSSGGISGMPTSSLPSTSTLPPITNSGSKIAGGLRGAALVVACAALYDL